MEPLHAIEYELTSELVTKVQQTLVAWELRRGWRRDFPLFAGVLVFAALIIWLGLEGWILPGVAGGLIALLALIGIGAFYRRVARANGAAMTALLALYSGDRQVRIEFTEELVRLETGPYRGEGAWTELDEIIVFADYWLLRLSNTGQILIPTSFVSTEMDAFIRAKAKQNMAPVRQG